MNIEIGVSNHHVHLNRDDLEILFGKGYELTFFKDLKQPGQFAAVEKVDVKTDKSILNGLRILGPVRDYTQVELSKTDSYILGIDPPVRSSGNLSGASVVEIVGPLGSVTKECAIIADRHIHITKEQRDEYGLNGVDEVSVKIDTVKGGIIDHVKIKESNVAYFEMHIDTDDANAFLLKNGSVVEILNK